MPVPNSFSRKLHELMGSEAADSMVDWMNRADENTSELRRELAEFRQTTRADFAELRQEMSSRFADLRLEMNTKFAVIQQDMNARFAALETAAAQRHADFLKWVLGSWAVSLLTVVGAVVGLAIALR